MLACVLGLVLLGTAPEPHRVVVGPIEGNQLPPGEAERLQSNLLTHLSSLPGVNAVGLDRLRSVPAGVLDAGGSGTGGSGTGGSRATCSETDGSGAEASRSACSEVGSSTTTGPGAPCLRNAPCLAALHRRTGASSAVWGTLVRMGSEWALSLRRARLPEGTLEAAATRRGPSPAVLAAQLSSMVAELYPNLPPDLSAQPHNLWQPQPRPLHPAWFTTGAVLTLGSLVTGVVFLAQSVSTSDALAAQIYSEEPDAPRIAQLYDLQAQQSLISTVALATAGGLGVLSIVAGLFTQWGPDDLGPSIHLSPAGASARWLW